jgi:5-methylcytosine-specific restriction endonuclease McrA
MQCSAIPDVAWLNPRITMRKGRAITMPLASLRTVLAEAQNWRCCYCYTTLDPEGQHGPQPTLEHIIPLVAGGLDATDNLVIACKRCNSSRGHADAYAFRPSYSRFWATK